MNQRRILIVVGMVAGLAGLSIALTRASIGAIETILLIAGLACFAGALLGRSGGRGNALNLGLAIGYSVFCIGALVFAFLLAKPRLPETDLTSARLNTLSSLSRNWLARLDRPIQITAFLVGDQTDTIRREFDRLREITPHISYQILDPLRDSTQALSFGAQVYPGDVFVESGDRQRQLNVLEGMREGDLINALVAVTLEGPTTLYFLTGHGEKRTTSAANENDQVDTVSVLAGNLRRGGYDVQPLDLLTTRQVPDDAMALVVFGPELALRAGEADAILAFLRDGGRVILSLGAGIVSDVDRMSLVEFDGWKRVTSEVGITIEDALVVDLVGRDVHGSELIAVPAIERGSRPIAPDDPTYGGLGFFNSRAMTRKLPPPPGITTTTLLESSPQSFHLPIAGILEGTGQQSVDPEDAAPRALVLEARIAHPSGDEAQEGRLLIFGSPLPFTDAAATVQSINLFIKSAKDMTAESRSSFLPIPDRRLPDQLLRIDAATFDFMLILHLLFVPGCIFFGGLGIAFARRDAA